MNNTYTIMLIGTKKRYLWPLATFFVTFIYYYTQNFGGITTPEMNENDLLSANQEFLINTPGCSIPNYAKSFLYNGSIIKPLAAKNSANRACGIRAIYIRTLRNNKIKFIIYKNILNRYKKKYLKGSQNQDVSCCFRFANQAEMSTKIHRLDYTKCKTFKDGAKVEQKSEIITVTCTVSKNNRLIKIYKDAYIILKKKNTNNVKLKNKATTPWNILLLGVDTMSRARIFDTMPLTTKYLQKLRWLDYKGYQKVDDNTFPNLISVLTGKNMSAISSKCESDLYKCADYFIWEKYKNAGYKTAYGEDNVELPDTFSKYNGFKQKPTDHYLRPFYLTGEKRRRQILCANKKPSATHLLHYAHSFVNAYKNNNFFGFFWINSYTHNEEANPSLIDAEIENFFKRLHDIGTLNNTFVIFFSDHGVRFGKMRLKIESYYDERLPMLFIWTPHKFQKQYIENYKNLYLNQNRLTTTYDLYMTLIEILKLSTKSTDKTTSEACPKCTSLFEEKSPLRTCADAGVSDVWCSCHNMSKVKHNDLKIHESMHLVAKHLRNKLLSIKTIPCMTCTPMKRASILRSHVYHQNNKKYYVIAFQIFPNRIGYEAKVFYNGNISKVLSVRTISSYNSNGYCTLNPNHRAYCLCIKAKKC